MKASRGVAHSPAEFESSHGKLAERERAKLEARVREAEVALKKEREALAVAEDIRREVFGLAEQDLAPPKWIEPIPRGKGKRVSMPVMLISDEQVGERVLAAEVEGVNHYDHNVYVQRHDLCAQKLVEITEHHMGDQKCPVGLIAFLGDAISGEIHAELAETNTLQSIPSTALVVETRRNAIDFWLKHFEQLFIIVLPGNHGRCLEASTEVLTADGWQRADAVTEHDLFASIDMETRRTSFVPCESLTHFRERGAWQIDGRFRSELVTREHKVPFKGRLVPAEELAAEESAKHFELDSNGPEPVGDDLNYLRLVAWTVFDGTVVDRSKYDGESGYRLQFRLKKDRKVEALRDLLASGGTQFTHKVDDDGVTTIRIYGDAAKRVALDTGAGKNKTLPERYARLGKEELAALLEVILATDGRAVGAGGCVEWASTCRENVDIVQAACALNGVPMRSRLIEEPSGYENRQSIFVCSIQPHGQTARSGDHKVAKQWVDEEFDFVGIQVCHGTLITRRDGKACVTGNTTMKPRFKRYAKMNYETLIGWWLQSLYAKDPRVKIVVPESADYLLPVWGRGLFFTHGDRMGALSGKGAGMGFAGPVLPIVRGSKNIRDQQASFGRRIDYIHVGHYHEQGEAGGTFFNGTMAGYSEFAHGLRFRAAPAMQTLYFMNEEHGATARWPIFLSKSPVANRAPDITELMK